MTPKTMITDALQVVGRRTRTQRLFECLCSGLLFGTLLAIPVIILHLFGYSLAVSPWGMLGAFAGLGTFLGGITGLLTGLLSPQQNLKDSARRIDAFYQLKDRLITSLKIIFRKHATVMERLQVMDAAVHAKRVEAKIVVPYRIPKNFYRAMMFLVIAVTLCLISPYVNRSQTLEAALPVEEVVAVTEQLKEELLEPVEEIAKENPEEKPLEKLSEELQKLVEQMENQSNNPKEALATLSQMEAAMNQAISEFNLEAMDASMLELADALSAAESTRSASMAMKAGEYAKAADELEKSDASAMSKQERKAVSDQLKKTAAAMLKRNQEPLAKLTEKLADDLQESNGEGCKNSACEIAGICRKQGLRKGICQGLGCKLALLSLCKSECAGACACNKDGGNSNQKSNNSSKNWGRGTAGDPASGQETSLDSKRELKQVAGMQGAGPSEFETMKSQEGSEETSNRSYKEAYREYQKMSESVLESEPIPLGQRQMIRRYFESIRPQGEEKR